MSEGAPEPTGSAQGQEGAEGEGQTEDGEGGSQDEQNPDELSEQVAHWRTQARRHERSARQNAAAARELETLKASQMSEIERAQHERDEAKRERDEARADHTRVMAAAAHDLPVELIDYLGDGTEEEINDRAEAIGGAIQTMAQELAQEILAKAGFTDEILANGGQPGGRPNGGLGRRPVESMRPGGAPSAGGSPQSADDYFRQLLTGGSQ